METKVSAVQVPCELAEKLETVAACLDRSHDWIIEQGLTLEALADVDAGRIIAHQAVQAWADSLENDSPLPLPRP
jgi:predicted transcriptional regulator